jgi:hypothetical protein
MPACKIYNKQRRSEIHKNITNKLGLSLYRGKLLREYLTVPTVNRHFIVSLKILRNKKIVIQSPCISDFQFKHTSIKSSVT